MRGEEVGIYRDVSTRNKIDLSGRWEYSVGGETWSDVNIPASMEFDGRVQFRRKFSVGEEELRASAFKVVSFGVNHECEIYINGNFVGKHVGGYTAFEFPVPLDALELGSENVIQISVNNVLNSRTSVPVRKQVWAWRNYGGLVRDLFLLVTPRLWIDDVRLKTSVQADGKLGSLEVHASLSNNSFVGLHFDSVFIKGKLQPLPSRVISVELIDKFSGVVAVQSLSEPLTFEQGKDLDVSLALAVPTPKRWSVENPDLYIARISLLQIEAKQRTTIDQFVQQIGFVDREFVGQSIRTNGRDLTLKGIVWHEEAPGVGMSLSYEQMEKDIASIKSLGANAVRFAFHPPHPYVVELCARFGLYALEEIPVCNIPADILADESFQSNADASLRETILRDRHNPAVLAWGIGNQIEDSQRSSVEYARRAARLAQELDARPIYFSSRFSTNDIASAETPLAALSMPSVDVKSFKRILVDWKKSHANQSVMITGFGKEVDQANRNGWSDPMSQEAQARYFLQYLAAIKEANITGSFVDAYADWRGDRPIMTVNQFDHYVHPVGLTSEKRERRLSYEMIRTLYNGEKANAILVGTYRSSFPLAHVLSGLFIIIIVAHQYTYNRRFGEAVKRSLTRSYNFYADLRDSRTVSIVHTLLLALCISATLAVTVSSILYFYRADKLADYLFSLLLTWDLLKEQFIFAAWHPAAGIILFSALFFSLFVLFAAVIKLFAFFVRTRVTWFHVFSVTAWGAIPIVFLGPVAMSLSKVMESSFFIVPSMAVIVGFMIWTWTRVVSGIAVIYDVRPFRAYLGAVLACAILTCGILFFYETNFAFFAYAKLALNVARSSSL
jgi:hypothetical protein